MTKYEYNVNKNCIEKDGQFFAYFNVIDVYKIINELNKEAVKPNIPIETLNNYIDSEIILLRKRANEPNQESAIKHDFLFLADYLERMKKGINEWAGD